MRFLNKKGISPLVATILLIGFTVALAAIVITWGTGFVKNITSGTEERSAKAITCTSDLNFDIVKVTCDNNPDPNLGTSTIMIDNKGDLEIKGFALRFFKQNGDGTGVTNAVGLGKFEVKTLGLYPGTIPQLFIPVGTVRVEALATIELKEQNVTCSEAAKTKTFSPAC